MDIVPNGGGHDVSTKGPAAGNCCGYQLGRSRSHQRLVHRGLPVARNAGGGPPNAAGLKTPINVEILDMIEEGDRVAVRWQLTATCDDGKPYEQSIMAIYRFENGRIAEDWGVSSRHPGLETSAAGSSV